MSSEEEQDSYSPSSPAPKQIGKDTTMSKKIEKAANRWLLGTHSGRYPRCQNAYTYRQMRKCKKEAAHLLGKKSKGSARVKITTIEKLEEYQESLSNSSSTNGRLYREGCYCEFCDSFFEGEDEKNEHVNIFHNTCKLGRRCPEKNVSCPFWRECLLKQKHWKKEMRRTRSTLPYINFKCLRAYSGQNRYLRHKPKKKKTRVEPIAEEEQDAEDDAEVINYLNEDILTKGIVTTKGMDCPGCGEKKKRIVQHMQQFCKKKNKLKKIDMTSFAELLKGARTKLNKRKKGKKDLHEKKQKTLPEEMTKRFNFSLPSTSAAVEPVRYKQKTLPEEITKKFKFSLPYTSAAVEPVRYKQTMLSDYYQRLRDGYEAERDTVPKRRGNVKQRAERYPLIVKPLVLTCIF